MKLVLQKTSKIAFLLSCLLMLNACAGPSAHVSSIEPNSIDMRDEKPIIHQVTKGSPADGVVKVGDTIVEANGQVINNWQEWVDYTSSVTEKAEAMDYKVSLVSVDGSRKEVAWRQLNNPFNHEVYVKLSNAGQAHKMTDPRRHIPVSVVRSHGFITTAWLNKWSTTPQILEADIIIKTDKDCHKCSVDGISLYSTQIEKELPLVPPAVVGNMVFERLSTEQAPSHYVNVPSPTFAGIQSTTFTSGTISPTGFNSPWADGQYNLDAISTTTTRPIYDYTAQNMAVISNLIASVRNKSASRQSDNRLQFIETHNPHTLATGKLEPDKLISGTLLFANLGNSEGPFELRIKQNGDPIIMSYGGKKDVDKKKEEEKTIAQTAVTEK